MTSGGLRARPCQPLQTFMRGRHFQVTTVPDIGYIACYQLAVLVIYQYISYLCCVLLHFSVRAFGQAYSLTSFGMCAGFLSDLAMCMDAKRRLSFLQVFKYFNQIIFVVFNEQNIVVCKIFFCCSGSFAPSVSYLIESGVRQYKSRN